MNRPINLQKVLKEVQADELPEIKRLALLMRTASQAEINEVDVMGGGLTNRNFKVTLSNGQKVAVRLAGKGTSEYMNRPAEKRNATLMASLGINAEIYFFDLKTGSQLSQFIEGDTMHPEDFQTNTKILKDAADIMRKYHQSGFDFADVFSPMREIQGYARILRDNNFDEVYEEMPEIRDRLLDVMEAYAENPQKLVPCHNDPLSENFMFDGEKLYLIDWEYAGMNDPTFDLAAIINENNLNEEAQTVFLEHYYGGSVSEEQQARVHISRLVADAMWCVWSLVQICNGKEHDFYWNYGKDRAEQCVKFIHHPQFDAYLSLIATP